jgi:DNA-binding HTH domain-containing proteins
MFERLIPAVIEDRSDRVHLVDLRADALFATALDGVLKQGAAYSGSNSVPIPSGESRPPMIVGLLPLRRTVQDVFLVEAAVVTVTPVDRSNAPAAVVLERLFDLTPAEAKVAQGIGSARSVEALANSLGISRETVRSQLKAVMAKTGAGRQSELVSLLAGKEFPQIAAGSGPSIEDFAPRCFDRLAG